MSYTKKFQANYKIGQLFKIFNKNKINGENIHFIIKQIEENKLEFQA